MWRRPRICFRLLSGRCSSRRAGQGTFRKCPQNQSKMTTEWEAQRELECPNCGEWIGVTGKHEYFDCLWCNEPLLLNIDADFRDGVWHDLTKLVSNKNHIQRMIDHAKNQKP